MNLKEDQTKIKNEIDSQKINYENLVDREIGRAHV